jgi:Flp pilus assembly protein TadD
MPANAAETLSRIAAEARAGRLDSAALMVEQARAAGMNDPTVAALGGAVEFHRGQFARAVPLLREAAGHHPQDLTIRANLAEALLRTGASVEALVLCDPENARADRSLRLAAMGGHLAQEAGNNALAIELYRLVSAARPDDWSIWNNLGNALAAVGDSDEAVTALQRAATLAPDSAPIRLNLGNTLYQLGRIDEAETCLTEAARDFPKDPNPHVSLTMIYRETGREDEAYSAIAEAARRAPDNAGIQSDHGQEAARRNDYTIAEQAFNAALSLNPALGPSFVGLASVFERMNREDELDPLYARATAAGIDAESIAFIEALRFKRAGEIEPAFAALEQAGDVIVPGRKHHLRGVMLDRLGRHAEAYVEFTAMNQHWQQDPTQPLERARLYREMVNASTAVLTPEWAASWSPDIAAPEQPDPIFVLGFPRSGTTLLDTMLMADPTVRVLEEEPFIGLVEAEFEGIEALADASQEVLAAARASYFAKVFAQLGPLDGLTLVDKHPLHLNKAAVIRRLFPQARFVLALRHPCDVVLSCYLTNFRINNAMANFLDLDDSAALYDLSFTHWERARTLFDLQVRPVVYERLIEDQTRELAPLFDWLGLAWPGDRFDHREVARARGPVATASYAQVTEPIYTRAAGRWQRYREELQDAFPVLQPWIDRFGYSVEDGRFADWPEQDG